MTALPESELRARFVFDRGVRFELAYSLEVLLRQDALSLAAWRAEARSRAPAALVEDLAWFGDAPAFWVLAGDALGSTWHGENVPALVAAYRALDPKRLLVSLVAGAIHDVELAGRVAALELDLVGAIGELPPARREWLEHIGLHPPERTHPLVDAINRCIRDPEGARTRIARFGVDTAFRTSSSGRRISCRRPSIRRATGPRSPSRREQPFSFRTSIPPSCPHRAPHATYRQHWTRRSSFARWEIRRASRSRR